MPKKTPAAAQNHQWLQSAWRAAEKSMHPSVRVGAVITTPDGSRILAAAANNPPDGIRLIPARLVPGEKSLWFMCAEKRALALAQRRLARFGLSSLKACRIYSTLMPCHTCAHDIIQAGLQWVCVPAHATRRYPRLKKKYRRSMAAAEEMFIEKGIKLVAVPDCLPED
mgnify:CR=1 FL=1